MTRMTGPDCVVMCNLINTYIHTDAKGETGETLVERGRDVEKEVSVQ